MVGKRFNRALVRTRVWRVFSFRPRTLRAAETSRKSWQRALSFSAPNSGMHQTLVQKRSDMGPWRRASHEFGEGRHH